MLSIIVRSKNEEKWIAACLEGIFKQIYQDFEVILVDNSSTDRTLEKAARFPISKVITIDQFLPGRAINMGIRQSRGDFVVCISAHCIPVNEHWLDKLLQNFDDAGIAGVYGRQEPMSFTSDVDKRDLINLFGLDKRIQKKDPFFHNANSMIRRDVWEKYPFDEKATNIEDRIWAKTVLAAGYQIAYEPDASVYHYHGINQGRDLARAKSVVRILEQIHPITRKTPINTLQVTAIIPVRGELKRLKGKPLLARAIQSAKASEFVSQVVVASDNVAHLELAEEMGAETVLRPPDLSADYIGLEQVYRFIVERISKDSEMPDVLVLLEEIYPFRPHGLIDSMVEMILNDNYDSIIAAHTQFDLLWQKQESGFVQIDAGAVPSHYKEPVYVGSIGLAAVTHPTVILQGSRLGSKVGLVEVQDPFSHIKVSREIDLVVAEALEGEWQQLMCGPGS